MSVMPVVLIGRRTVDDISHECAEAHHDAGGKDEGSNIGDDPMELMGSTPAIEQEAERKDE
jgi:hypothetical protein